MQSSVSVNWCPALGTVLANEEVINGLSERGDHPVQRLPLRQWILKITNYADRLEGGLEGLEWPSGTMTAQKQWIGKSVGCKIDFPVDGSKDNEVSPCLALDQETHVFDKASLYSFSRNHGVLIR